VNGTHRRCGVAAAGLLFSSTSIRRVAGISRDDIEDYEVWPSGSPGVKGALLANTHRQRLPTLHAFLERVIEWDWPDAPPRNPALGGDIPEKPEPLPKSTATATPHASSSCSAETKDRRPAPATLDTPPSTNIIRVTAATRVPLLPQSRWLAGMRRVARGGEQISQATAARRLGGGHDHVDDGRDDPGRGCCPAWWTGCTEPC
jgi:hypothetical protein